MLRQAVQRRLVRRVSKVLSQADLGDALSTAAHHDRKVMIEQAMNGHEVECAVLGNDEPTASGVAEIHSQSDFYTYEAKYQDDATQTIVPAEIPDAIAEHVRQLSLRAYRAIDAAGMARVDFFARDDGLVQIIEINTLPGFTPISQFPRLWQEAGISYPELISHLVDLAFERHANQNKQKLERRAPR